MIRVLLVVLLCSSCFLGGSPVPPVHVGDADVMVVSDVKYPVDPIWWRGSRWYNSAYDMATPNRVVISGDYACVQDAGTIDNPRNGDAFHCPGGWRAPGGHPRIQFKQFPPSTPPNWLPPVRWA